jgi:hypothetical protein
MARLRAISPTIPHRQNLPVKQIGSHASKGYVAAGVSLLQSIGFAECLASVF